MNNEYWFQNSELQVATMRNSIGVLAATMLLVGTVNAQIRESNGKNFLWKQCNEDVIKLYVDPGPFQQLLPDGYTVLLFEGQAWVLIIAQDCPYYRYEGEDVGSAHDVHVWVAIEGSQDIWPVVSAERTVPTMTWFNLFAGSDNARVREAWVASGTASVPIESVSLDPPASERGGQVLLNANQGFSWIVKTSKAEIRLLEVNHDVYERSSTGTIVLNRIQALLNVSAYDSPGTLEVVGGLGREGSISAGTYNVEVHSFFPIWARATLGEDLPE